MRAFVIDAFTDTAFRGNPAGVVLLDIPADAGWMQDVAAELRHSETAFVLARGDGGYDLRWFTPTTAVDLCGHATLATTHALHECGATGPFTFFTRSGELHTEIGGDHTIAMDFPAESPVEIPPPAGLAEALGVAPLAVLGNGTDVVVDLGDAPTVRTLVPDLAALAAVECRGVVVTAAAAPGSDHDFVSRFFGPRVGVDEDPVTGSAHCALGPLWAGRLGRTDLVGLQLSRRGGRVAVQVRGERVTLRGTAVTVLDGELRV
jgi:PhzF family phenazine biosynthesis protein